jgi:hypothetical protein
MMKLTIGHCGLIRPLLLIALLVPIVIIPNLYPQSLSASESDLKPGDTIGPHNWERVKGMVGENLLNRIKQGYTFKIKQGRVVGTPKEFSAATSRYSAEVKLGPNGELVNYVAGLPFPDVSINDPQAGLKLIWNFYWRWLGDDYKTGGGTAEGKIVRHAIEKNGSERRADVIHHSIKTRGRVHLDAKPVLPGYEHIDWMQLRADEYPRDTAGTTTLEIRYADPKREDDLYIYVPSIRRVRRAPPIQRCATIAPSEFNFDDINNFSAKVSDFNYRLLGRVKMLGNFSQERVPFERKTGDYLPLKESWEVVDAYGLEITPKNPSYCYPRKYLFFDARHFEALWTMTWDAQGNYWKEAFSSRTVVKLTDGQEAISVGTVVIANAQNGRSTLVDAVRSYNQGYQPTLFTLATLQTVMRGGSLR